MAESKKAKSKASKSPATVRSKLPGPMTDGGQPLSWFWRSDDGRDDDWRDDGFRSPPVRIVTAHTTSVDPDRGRKAVSLGWHPDGPDPRDLTVDDKATNKALGKNAPLAGGLNSLPKDALNIEHCSPIENQGSLGSCTAQATVSLMEYEMKRRGVAHVEGSRLFVYKVTRNLLGWTGDTGAFLRDSIKAVAAFGVPPEEYWPYDISRFEEEPTAFLYAYGQNYKALNYRRLDPRGQSTDVTLKKIKRTVANGYAVVFGFTVFDSMSNDADIEFPSDLATAKRTGGHAVMVIGYDDNHKVRYIDNNSTEKVKTVPSLVIRNSWGTGWGQGGYGFLPYEYVTEGASADFWTVFNSSWMPGT